MRRIPRHPGLVAFSAVHARAAAKVSSRGNRSTAELEDRVGVVAYFGSKAGHELRKFENDV